MAYVEQSDLVGMLDDEDLLKALDDDGDLEPDAAVWAGIVALVGDAIDGRIGGRYSVPLSGTLPAAIRLAARVFAAEALYARRGMTDAANPWKTQGDEMRARLERIGKGEEPLSVESEPAAEPVVALTEAAKTYSGAGSMMV